jgi:predicted MPP superfamily phosphohydrolase
MRHVLVLLSLLFSLTTGLASCSQDSRRESTPPNSRSAPDLASLASSEPKELRVTVVSDIHPGQSDETARIAQSMLALHRDAADLWGTLFLGDVTNGNSESEWQIFAQLFAPLMQAGRFEIISGNHDYPQDKPGQAGQGSILEQKIPGFQYDYAASLRNVHLVFLDTGNLRPDLSDAQWRFLENELAKAADLKAKGTIDWSVVALHQPIVTAGDKREDSNMVGFRPRFAQLFKQFGVDVVLSGHQHVAQATVLDGTLFLTTPSGGGVLRNSYNPSFKSFKEGADFSQKNFSPEFYMSTYGFLDLTFGATSLHYRLNDSKGKALYSFSYPLASKQVSVPQLTTVHVCAKEQQNLNLSWNRDSTESVRVPMHRNPALGACWYTQKIMRPETSVSFRVDNQALVDRGARQPPYESPVFTTAEPEVFIYRDSLRPNAYFSDAAADGRLEAGEMKLDTTVSPPTLRLLRNDSTRILLRQWCGPTSTATELTAADLTRQDDKYSTYALPTSSCEDLIYQVLVEDGEASVSPLVEGQGQFIQKNPATVRLLSMNPIPNSLDASPASRIELVLSRQAEIKPVLVKADAPQEVIAGNWTREAEANNGQSERWVFTPARRLPLATAFAIQGLDIAIASEPLQFATRNTAEGSHPLVDGSIRRTDAYAYLLNDTNDNPWGRHGDFDTLRVHWDRRGVYLGVEASLFNNDYVIALTLPAASRPSCAELGPILSRPHRLSTNAESRFALFLSLTGSGLVRAARPAATGTCDPVLPMKLAEAGIEAVTKAGQLEVFLPWDLIGQGLSPFGIKGVMTTARGEYVYGDMIPNNRTQTRDGQLDSFFDLTPDEDADRQVDAI